jgi:hypothetical protein
MVVDEGLLLSSHLVRDTPLVRNPFDCWGVGMRRLVSIVWGFGIGTLVCLPAMAAATVKVVQGQVSVNQGQGYKQVATATAVSTGDRVMAAPGSRGKLVYADGCTLDVHPGAVVTVPEKCYQPMTAGLEQVPVEARPWGAWIPYVGAAAVIGVGACAVAGCFDDDDGGRRRVNGQPNGRTPDGGDNND